MNLKKIALTLISFIALITLVACGGGSKKSSNDKILTFTQAKKSAYNKTVTFYGFGGDEKANQWVDQVIAPAMKMKYNITVRRVPMDIDNILNQLMSLKEVGSNKGNIDVVWINGENFYTAKQADLLYGPFANEIPNFEKLMDTKSHNSQYDFGVKINGYEVPYGTAQIVFSGDKTKFPEGFPTSAKALMAYAETHPGKITYTAPPEFTGSAFVRNIICNIIGYKKLEIAPATKEGLYKVIKPALDYLNELKPYLWQKGKTYPTTTAELDQMYSAGQINLAYSYSQTHVATERDEGVFNSNTESFLFDKGTIANESYLAIPKSSQEKAAAMLLINEMTNENTQLEKASSKYGYSIPPFDSNKLSNSSKQKIADIYKGKGVLSLKELQAKQIPEIQAKKVAVIESLWKEYVLHG